MSDPFKKVLSTPQVARWTHEGIECAVHQHPDLGLRNGYVLIPDGNPLEQSADWGEHYCSESLLDVHGGVTYGPNKVDGGHVVGFDTGHAGDYSPAFPFGRRWSIDDVVTETNRMAEQVAQWGRSGEWVAI